MRGHQEEQNGLTLLQYECCEVIIDTWVDMVAQGRSNVPPAKLPWDLMRTLITEMYGGKIDDEGDFNILGQLVSDVLDPAAFEDEHLLAHGAEGDEGLRVPDGRTMQDFSTWVEKLPEREPPTYLGLPADAEKLLLVGQAQRMVADLEKISDLLDEEQMAASAA
jgi:dynein heavy chain 1, cytosolic